MTLKAFVSDSALPQEDKDLWFSVLENLEDAQIRIYEEFIDNREENLLTLTKNLRDKIEAIQNLDEGAMENIVEQQNV